MSHDVIKAQKEGFRNIPIKFRSKECSNNF